MVLVVFLAIKSIRKGYGWNRLIDGFLDVLLMGWEEEYIRYELILTRLADHRL
jgi:hypothetical protein